MRNVDRVALLVGVSPVDGMTSENPFLYTQREDMILRSLKSLKTSGEYNKPLAVYPLLDKRNDKDWCDALDRMIASLFPGDEVGLYHGRDSGFVKAYTGRYPLVDIEPVAGDDSGRAVRAAIGECSHEDFMRGQAYALHRQFPHAYPTVDVAILRHGPATAKPEVLLIQRADTGVWCFPGGFVDPTDKTLELAARREMHEELGLVFEGGLHYITSCKIPDWRYRGSRDGVMTTFFAADFCWGPVTLKPDEVVAAQWYDIPGAVGRVSDTHLELAKALAVWVKKNSR